MKPLFVAMCLLVLLGCEAELEPPVPTNNLGDAKWGEMTYESN